MAQSQPANSSLTTGVHPDSETVHIENGERVYPCRCGETHRGPYADYDWDHHNCFHHARLIAIDVSEGYYMCPDCGQTFYLAHDHDTCPECGGDYVAASAAEGDSRTYECSKGHEWGGPAQPFPGPGIDD